MGYEQMAQAALRGVVRMVLERAAAQGLPGDHHFYITFDTRHPGVKLADYLRARYPEDMTIVLQHQFWGLKIQGDSFEVTLSFNKVGEHIVVPFSAVKAFFDPSVQFGLQFKSPSAPMVRRATPPALAGSLTQDQAHAGPPQQAENATVAEEKPKAPAPAGEVVSLDAFRKK